MNALTIWDVPPGATASPRALRKLVEQIQSSEDPRAIWKLTNCMRHAINWWTYMWGSTRGDGERDQLQWSDELANAALFHAIEMHELGYLASESPHGDTPQERAEVVGYTGTVVEFIGAGSTVAWDIFRPWIDEARRDIPLYRKGLLNPALKVVGVAHHEGTWVALFGEEIPAEAATGGGK